MDDIKKELKKEIEQTCKGLVQAGYIETENVEEIIKFANYLMSETMSSAYGIEDSDLRDTLIRMGKIAKLGTEVRQ